MEAAAAAACNYVVNYSYDAWGNPLATTIPENTPAAAATLGTINPLRYRGYVYDQETQLYYLQSRYYNPQIGRFISADNAVSGPTVDGSLLGANLYSYCFNNSVNMIDSSGNWPSWLEKAAKVVAVVAVVVTAVVLVSVATAGTGGAALAAAGVAFGTACGGLVGGLANESKGESFVNGWTGGAVNGFVQSASTAAMSTVGLGSIGTIAGGSVGSALGTAVTENLNNIGKPKEQQKTTSEITSSSLQAGGIGAVMSIITAGMGYCVDYAQSPAGYNSWGELLHSGAGIAPITPGFGEMMKGFFSVVDDALVYIFCGWE